MEFLAITAITILVVVPILFKLRDRKTPPPIPARKTGPAVPSAPPPVVPQPKDEPQISTLDAYPALSQIAYRAVLPDLLPQLKENINPEVIRNIRKIVSTVKPIPVNYVRLLTLLRSPESHPGEITSVVMTNPVFSAKILRSANSAYFHFTEKITSVGRAITLLGYNNVRALVLQEALNSVVPETPDGVADVYSATWTHSAVVSACAGYLGKSRFRLPEYELATAGLLHDLGKYFIPMLDPIGEGAADLPLVIQEEQTFGINHAAFGSLIANAWNFSELIEKSIEYHACPAFYPPQVLPESYALQTFIITLSDLICKVLGYSAGDQECLQIRSEYFDLFKMSPDIREVITPGLIREIEKAHLTVQSYTDLN